ncbi:hypothetical protein N7468_003147 [Penicillium chermesinum]|uniref:Uncharacterized protein n=1 Tax=Penicillium chermesinum TaxID=63820 RepID=A0A9W9P8I7_9EURO|nr:uncharacterized protein N7468_003147 [Penicillium chermesinum]KAJ5238528.1 hypothetical protein N7468_003147 [Penicillium chermesinum]
MFGCFGQSYDPCKLAILTTGLSLVTYFVIKLMKMRLKLLEDQSKPEREPGFEDLTWKLSSLEVLVRCFTDRKIYDIYTVSDVPCL